MRTPDGWTTALLEELTDPARPIRYGIVQPGRFDPDGRYMIRGQDYSEARGWARPGDFFRVSARVESRYRKARVRAGDLIITIVGAGTGYVETVPGWLDGANLTQTTARIAIRPDVASPQFCKYLLQSDIGSDQVATYVKGNAQPGLNIADVKKFAVALPRREVQDQIVKRLQDSDALISSLRMLIAKKHAIKQGMMHDLLTGTTRLPGFTGAWADSTIGSLARVTGGGTPATRVPSYWGGSIPWFTPSEIDSVGSGLVARSDRTISAEGLANSAAKLVPAGTVLVTSRASIGNVAVAEVPVTTNQGFASLIPRDTKSTWFLYYWIQQFKSELESRAAGSTFLEISAAKVRDIELRAPSLPAQQAIGSAIRDADEVIAALERRLLATRAIKQGMMQCLLTGQAWLVPTKARA